jgi:hypothetical protein
MRISTLVLAVLLLPLAATAQIYQWKDASGKVQYSDQRPPATAKQERTFTPRLAPAPAATPAADADAPPAAASLEEQEIAFKQRQVEQEEARAKQEQEDTAASERKRNCELARGNLQNLQVGGRQVRFDPKTGERAYLSDVEATQTMKDAQRAVEEWCSPQTLQR